MSGIIPKEKSGTFQRWHIGAFDHPHSVPAPAASPQEPEAPEPEVVPVQQVALPSAEDVERIFEEARTAGYQEGYETGLKAGQEAGAAAVDAEIHRFSQLAENFQQALGGLEQDVADQLLALSTEIAAQMLRSTLSIKQDVLLPIIREAVSALPVHHTHMIVRLNPEDAARIYPQSGAPVEAEVVGFAGEKLYLMPSDDIYGLAPGARVVAFETPSTPPRIGDPPPFRRRAIDRAKQVPVGEELLGRVLDGVGRPLDNKGPVTTTHTRSLQARPVNPMSRAAIHQPLDVGIRAINALLTVGRGQRMGLFAGSGVGKSVLLGMMARYTEAEVIVVGLIGERGREVKEFIEQILGDEGMRRAVVVAAPADTGPLMRLQGAAYATTIAEYFRDQGKQVLLIMDSLTRYAMAQREIALAIGEPPATRGYPPSVFARLPQLVERAGNGPEGGGSITAFYTVLAEGDDQQDPIADSARAILDGHIVLSRTLADAGHYPAIDIEQSISRAMVNLIPQAHLDQIRRFKVLFSRYQRSRDLIAVGAYAPGSDPVLDQAINAYPRMEGFLQQQLVEQAGFNDSVSSLSSLF